MKHRNPSRVQAIEPSIRTWFSTPALIVSAALSWSLSAQGATDIFSTAGTFNWVCPPGVTSIQVECWGGGGAGGGASKTGTANVGGGGGGGGAYASRAAVPVTPGNTYVITIPPAATCPSSFINDARYDGATVTFTGDLGVVVTAAGGTGGQCKVATTTTLTGTGGAGGTIVASIGDTVRSGGNGTANTSSNGGPGGAGASDLANGNNATASSSTAGATTTGSDANHNGGAGGAGRTGENAGNAGTSPGGGGGGGKVTTASTTRIGGAGGLGRIILTYTAPVNVKADNALNLNDPSSWTVGVPIGNLARWDSTVTSASVTSLGADLTFGGIQIADPAGPVTINAGNVLTLGSAATDLDLAAATQDLTLNCDLTVGAANIWDVASGRTVTLGGTVSGASTITKNGTGTVIFAGNSTNTAATSVTAGSLVYPSGSTFSPGGTGGVSGKLTVNGSSAEATIAGSYTAQGNGDAFFEIRSGGVLNFSGTANLSGGAGIRVGEGSAGTLNMTAGTLNAVMNSGSNLVVGRSAGAIGTLNLSGGAIYISNGGGLVIANTAGNSGTVTIGGTGQLAVISTGTSVMGPGTSTLNLNSGGTFTLGANLTTSGTSTSTINLDGGTLKAGRSSATFLPSSLTAVNVLVGGAIIDTNGYEITIPEDLLSGAAGDGGLTKNGNGTLILSGANTYNGATQVNGGTLKLAHTVPSTNLTAAPGAEAGVLVGTNDGQWVNTGNLTLQNGAAVVIDYGSTVPSITTAPIQVANFSIGTTPGVRLIANPTSALAPGQTFPLVTWTGSGPADGTAFSCLTHRLTGTFSVSSNTLFFTVTGNSAGAPLSWNTGNGNWDTNSFNWLDGSLVAAKFFDTLDSVLFGDASGASGNPVVNLAAPLSPVGVRMNSTARDYTVSGSGSITGSGALTLDAANTRTLTLATTGNAFTGGTNVNGGTLALGHATDSLPDSGAVAVDGAAAVLSVGANSDTVGAVSLKNGASITGSGSLTGTSFAVESGTVAASLGGTGALTKTTPGTVVLSGNNSRTGTTTVSAGTLRLAGTGALQATSQITMNGSSTLEFATDTAFSAFPTVSCSTGFTHSFVSDRATPGTGLTHVLGSANFGNSTYEFISGPNVTGGTAGITLNTVGVTAGATGTAILNPTTATVLITGGASISANSQPKTLALSGTNTGNEISGAITNGLNTLSLTKSGTGSWTLSGANTYTGTTTVSGGTLNLTGSLINAALGNAVVQAGGTLNVSGTIDGSTSSLTYGTTAGTANVNVATGASITVSSLLGANNTGAVSVYQQSGGTVTVGVTGTAESVYSATSGYGITHLTGGSLTANSRFTTALNGTGGGKGVTRVGGGAGPASLAAGEMLAVSRGAGSIGEMTILANGTVTFNATGANNMLIHGNNVSGTGFLNITGGTFSSPSTSRSVSFGNGTATNTSLGMINLGSGKLELGAGLVLNTIASGTNRGFVNLSGGTVKLLATTASNLLLPASNSGFSGLANNLFGPVTNSTVDLAGTGAASGISGTVGSSQDFAGGVTIDTNGFDTAITGPLAAPAGGGVAQGNISITDAGAGYAGAPLVVFSNPAAATASPAAGYALVSGGQLTGIVITSPGCYDPSDTVTVTLVGGGATTPATVADIPGTSLAANTSGGLTKTGAGTLTLGGANTYTGNTVVTGGTLELAAGGQLKFVLGASSGANNSITGTSATLKGSFVIDTSAADALPAGTWTLENVASLTGPGGYDASFSVAGFTDAGGNKWTKANGGKTYTFDETTGVLTLATSGYSSWASANGAGANLDDDHDGDGVANGVEYFLGGPSGNTTGFTGLPGAVEGPGGLSITWPKGPGYIGNYNTDFVVETSATLSGPWTVEASPGNVTDSPTEVKYTFPAPLSGKRFARLKVTGP